MKSFTPQRRRCGFCGAEIGELRPSLFPTTEKRTLILHRAGLLDYPVKKTCPNDAQSICRRVRESKLCNGENEPPNYKESGSRFEAMKRRICASPSPSSEHASIHRHEGEDLAVELEGQKQRISQLESKVQTLTNVGRKLVAAVSDSQKILSSSLDDPEAQEILNSLRSAEKALG